MIRECQICFAPYGVEQRYCSSCGAQTWPELPTIERIHGEDCCTICGHHEDLCYCDPNIEVSDNGIFKGSVIGIKATATIDGKTLFAFGPDEQTATERLRIRLAAQQGILQ